MTKEIKGRDIIKPQGEYNPNSIYICGVDVARTGKDETAIVILEKLPNQENIFVVFIETMSTPDLMTVVERVKFLDKIFRFKKVIVDETGLGAGVSDSLKHELQSRVEGIWYTQKSKAEMFNNLKILMSRPNAQLFIPDYIEMNEAIVRKMFYQFLSITHEVKEGQMLPKISHEDREHDDIVNAIALAATYFKVGGSRRRFPLAGGNR